MNLKSKDMILVGMFAALMVVGAYLRIPTPFVPITFQLFFAVFAGLLLKPTQAFLSQLVYIAIGLIGLPVFSAGGGLSYVVKPTFGYIIGFAVTATVISLLMAKRKEIRVSWIFVISFIGYTATYFIGNLYFYGVMNLIAGKPISLTGVLVMMLPYMIKDFLLLIIAAVTSGAVIPRLRRAGVAVI